MPPTPQKSYYDVLGLPKTASLDEIKKRYRELARQYHPDVNKTKPDAARIFSEITTAYKTLSNNDDRATYDADLALRERRASVAAGRGGGMPGNGSGPSFTNRPTPPGAPGSRPNPNARPTNTNAANTSAADNARLLAEARNAFSRGKLIEARGLCEQILRRDRRNAAAYEILGDVFRMQGRTDEALNMYTLSLQINPRNPTVMQRIERLSRTGPSAQQVFFDNRPRPGRPTGPGAAASIVPDKRPLKLMIGGVIGYGMAFLCILFAALFGAEPLAKNPVFFGPISYWTWPLVLAMGGAGSILGFTLAATNAIRRIDDELILTGSRSAGGFLPLGLVLIVVSFLSFYAAALLYAIIGFLQESLTPSMGRVLGAVITVVLLLTAVFEPGRGQVFLFGGNVVFLSLLIGWALGDFFKPEGM